MGVLKTTYDSVRNFARNFYDTISGTRGELKRAQNLITRLGNELQTSYTETDAARQANDELYARNQELQAQLDGMDVVRVSRLERDLKSTQDLVGHLKSERAQLRRQYKHEVATRRREQASACVTCIEQDKDSKYPRLVLNHTGRIIGQSPAAEQVFGDLVGKHYRSFVWGDEEQREGVVQYFRENAKGLMYVVTPQDKKCSAEVSIKPVYTHMTVQQGPEEVEEQIQSATILEINTIDWKWAWFRALRGERCLQKQMMKDAKKSARAEQIIQQARDEGLLPENP